MTHNGFEIEFENGDILLMSHDKTITLVDGHKELEESAIRECRFKVRANEDELDYDYDSDQVREIVNQNAESYVKEHLSEGIVTINE